VLERLQKPICIPTWLFGPRNHTALRVTKPGRRLYPGPAYQPCEWPAHRYLQKIISPSICPSSAAQVCRISLPTVRVTGLSRRLPASGRPGRPPCLFRPACRLRSASARAGSEKSLQIIFPMATVVCFRGGNAPDEAQSRCSFSNLIRYDVGRPAAATGDSDRLRVAGPGLGLGP
jgi:hypothetical protein